MERPENVAEKVLSRAGCGVVVKSKFHSERVVLKVPIRHLPGNAE